MEKVIGYIRKSTKDKNQKYSLESQRNKIQKFCDENEMEVVEWFQDIESGTRKDREGLMEALEICEKKEYALVVLRTDRLSRVPSQMFGLLENPSLKIYISELGLRASPMMIGQFILYSSFELDMLKRRTREGVATAIKKRRQEDPNFKWGGYITDESRTKAIRVRNEKADQITREYITLVGSLYNQTGSYSGTARELNKLGIKTQNEKKWYPSSVSNILSRYKNLGG
jgi:DNA invertase Pin-like site-specific DNA recombinase